MMVGNYNPNDIVADELEKLKQRIINNMRNANAVATGGTIKSLMVMKYNGGVKLVSAQKMPFGVMETGRVGKLTGKTIDGREPQVPMNFISIILAWMSARGIHGQAKPYVRNVPQKYSAQERGDRSLAGAIAKKIEMQGTKLHRMGGRNTIYSSEIPSTIDIIKKRVRGLFATEVGEVIKLNNPSTTIGE